MVLMPGKARGVAPGGEPQAQDTAPLLPCAGTSFSSAQLQDSTCSILTPCMSQSRPSHTDRAPLGMDMCVKSHQHIQRAPGRASEIKLEG